ncbi:MAG: 3'(2'),5'-bisphosphate nucleotidase [Cyanobacteriota bacterium]|nr:3'(2'),5'-bisphosphate nucleotidase [Cyanobacteriota bacterium]
MTNDKSLEKQIAIAATIEAAQLCDRVRQTPASPTLNKVDASPVTVADFGSQALICRALTRAFPRDPIVAEEDAGQLQQPEFADCLNRVVAQVRAIVPEATATEIIEWIALGGGDTASRYWTLDPIDGTKGYIRGDQYAIALALIENGQVELGLLACPALPVDPQRPMQGRGVLFVAQRDRGTERMSLDGSQTQRLRVNSANDFSQLCMIQSVESAHSDREKMAALAARLGFPQPPLEMDSQAKYGAIARGQADLYLRIPRPEFATLREKIWDHAAGAIVVSEAGGTMTDLDGLPLDFSAGSKLYNNRGIVASNGVIHEQVVAALKSL